MCSHFSVVFVQFNFFLSWNTIFIVAYKAQRIVCNELDAVDKFVRLDDVLNICHISMQQTIFYPLFLWKQRRLALPHEQI